VLLVLFSWGLYGGIFSSTVLVLCCLFVFLHPVTRNVIYNLLFRRSVYDHATSVYIYPGLGFQEFRIPHDTHPMGQPTNMGGNMGGVFVAPSGQVGFGH
jgi:hypothetical protein